MIAYQKFKELNIDHSAIGLGQNISYTDYFCTPIGAEIIAEAGVEGIHYCIIKGFEQMVFAVSPSALPGENVHPIAKNFEDLLKLLLACGSMDAIEQTYMWDEELFNQYLMDNQPGSKQCAIIDVIKETFHIAPMDNPFAYIKELQKSFDYSKLQFSEEYYGLLPEEEISEIVAPEWKVTYEGGFYPKRGRAGKEIKLDKEFLWANEKWHVPAVYVCTKGMVVDFCIEVDVDLVKNFINRWNLYKEQSEAYGNEELEQIQDEHPLNIDFQSKICVNGNRISNRQGYAVYWIPENCMPDGLETETEAKGILEHYGYDLEKAWAVHRISYLWEDKKPRTVKTLELKLEREKVKIPGETFVAPEVGCSFEFVNPVTETKHTITVREYEEREMDPTRFQNENMEWPTRYSIMAYTLFPEMEDFYIKDFCQGDSPRQKQINKHGSMTSSVGIIGLVASMKNGEEYYHPDGTLAKPRVTGSSMYFEKPKKTEWKITFREKRVPDIEVQLI